MSYIKKGEKSASYYTGRKKATINAVCIEASKQHFVVLRKRQGKRDRQLEAQYLPHPVYFSFS